MKPGRTSDRALGQEQWGTEAAGQFLPSGGCSWTSGHHLGATVMARGSVAPRLALVGWPTAIPCLGVSAHSWQDAAAHSVSAHGWQDAAAHWNDPEQELSAFIKV